MDLQETGVRTNPGDNFPNTSIRVVPVTLRVTQWMGSNVNGIGIEEVRAALASVTQTTSKNHSFYVGVKGEALSLENRYFYLPQSRGGFVYRGNVLEATALGVFQVGKDFYIQLSLTLGLGGTGPDGGFAAFSSEEKAIYHDPSLCKNCAGFAWDQTKTSDSMDDMKHNPGILSYDGEIQVHYRRFNLSLLSRMTPSQYQLDGSTGFYSPTPCVADYIAVREDTDHEKSIRLDYQLSKIGKGGGFAAFVGYSLFQNHEKLYNDLRVYPNETSHSQTTSTKIYEKDQPSVGVFRVGLSLKISPKLNHYDGVDVRTVNRSLEE